jgi:xanthine dehydrogenase accessory factor
MQNLSWFDAIHHCHQTGTSYVIATLVGSAGSTPRDSGTKMVITEESFYDTLGGGHLEFEVTKKAKMLLSENKQMQCIEHYPLASKLGQCCGGATNVLFEVFVAHNQHLAIYGAGHVAKALIPIISKLPLQISWIDPRPEMFEDQVVADNVKVLELEEPTESIKNLALNSWILVLTHNHQLDFYLISSALKRSDLGFIGMIGSDTKARRFQTRLAHRGFNEAQINRLTSPVGELSIPGKHPIEVAISIAAQLVQHIHAKQPTKNRDQQKQEWLQTKTLIGTL